jgi:RNA polymerase sigma-70 factor (ECF subfamily)
VAHCCGGACLEAVHLVAGCSVYVPVEATGVPPRRVVTAAPDLPLVEGFESFYRREFPRAVALAYALTGSGAVAEDVAQECLIAVHRNWDRIGGYDNPPAWLRRVLVNRATSLHRRRAAEWRAVQRLVGREASSATVPDLEPASVEVWSAVRKLPRRQAQAIALHYVDELSLEEIGAVLGCSAGTVKTHLHRGRRELSRRLDADDSQEATT